MKSRALIFSCIAFFILLFFLFSVASKLDDDPLSFKLSNIPTIHCCTQGILDAPDSHCFETSVEVCRSQGGAVQECGNFYSQRTQQPVGTQQRQNCTNCTNYTIQNVTQYPPNFSNVDFEADPIFANLTAAIRNASVFNNIYNISTYNCVNFSSDLEIALTAMGFNATYTSISWGHAITDVHIGPYTIFIEPQTNASRFYGPNGTYTYRIPYVSLDYERRNDSRIGVLINPNPYPNLTIRTEGRYGIIIYDNLTQAYNSGYRNRPRP